MMNKERNLFMSQEIGWIYTVFSQEFSYDFTYGRIVLMRLVNAKAKWYVSFKILYHYLVFLISWTENQDQLTYNDKEIDNITLISYLLKSAEIEY